MRKSIYLLRKINNFNMQIILFERKETKLKIVIDINKVWENAK